MDCLDESSVLRFVEGAMAPDEAAGAEVHLDGCSDCRRVLADWARASPRTNVTVTDPASAEPPAEAPALLERGATVGRYLILGLLGSGAMGVVYMAFDPGLDRKVALKLVRARLPLEAGLQARLQREAKAMARLAHPEVVAIHDVGAVDGQIFIAMEHVDGGTARTWLAAAPRSWREVLSLFVRAGRGLAAAHAAGLVHRDFKLDNLLVSADGRVRVSDFGLARLDELETLPLEAQPGATPAALAAWPASLTRTGALLGSPAYMAPELMSGQAAGVASDIFSFCVSLYEALHGERPFAGASLADLRAAIARGELRKVPAGKRVPAWLRRALAKGLRARPEERWPSMEALLATLSKDPAVTARRAVFGGAAVALLVAAAVAAHASVQRRAQLCRGAGEQLAKSWGEERRQAVHRAFLALAVPYAESAWAGVERALGARGAAWVAMRTEACEATRLRGEQSEELLDLRMQCLDQELQTQDALVALFADPDKKLLQRAVQAAESLPPLTRCANAEQLRSPDRSPTDPASRAKVEEVRAALARSSALFAAGRYKAALELALPAAATARGLKYLPLEAEVLLMAGRTQDYLDDFPAAEATLQQAALLGALGRRDDLAARALDQLILVVGKARERPAEGLRLAELAAAAIGRMGGDPDLEALRLQQIGTVLSHSGRAEEAIHYQEKALALRERTLGKDNPLLANQLAAVGIAQFHRGKAAEALQLFLRASDLQEARLGRDHPSMNLFLNNTAAALAEVGRLAEALPLMRRAIAQIEASVGPDAPSLMPSLDSLSNALRDLGQPAEAMAVARRCVAIGDKAFGPDSKQTASCHQELGLDLLALDRAKEALPELEHAVRIRAKGGVGASELAASRFALARGLWAAHGDQKRALQLAAAAREALAPLNQPKKLAAVEAWLASR